MFQADSLLPNRVKDGVITLILSNDADFMMFVGEECVQTKELFYKSKSKTVDNMTLSFACDEKAKSWLKCINDNSKVTVSMKLAECLLFPMLKI